MRWLGEGGVAHACLPVTDGEKLHGADKLRICFAEGPSSDSCPNPSELGAGLSHEQACKMAAAMDLPRAFQSRERAVGTPVGWMSAF